MIKAELFREDGILEIEPRTPLQVEDFEKLTNLLAPYYAENRILNGLLIHVEQFPGWKDISALFEHVKFIGENKKHIRKVAAVTDSTLVSMIPEVADKLLDTEVKHFQFKETEEAINWLKH